MLRMYNQSCIISPLTQYFVSSNNSNRPDHICCCCCWCPHIHTQPSECSCSEHFPAQLTEAVYLPFIGQNTVRIITSHSLLYTYSRHEIREFIWAYSISKLYTNSLLSMYVGVYDDSLKLTPKCPYSRLNARTEWNKLLHPPSDQTDVHFIERCRSSIKDLEMVTMRNLWTEWILINFIQGDRSVRTNKLLPCRSWLKNPGHCGSSTVLGFGPIRPFQY